MRPRLIAIKGAAISRKSLHIYIDARHYAALAIT
jgi:hypothetical protein